MGSYISYTIALRHFLYILFSSTIYPMGAIDFYSSDWISKHKWWFHCQILSADIYKKKVLGTKSCALNLHQKVFCWYLHYDTIPFWSSDELIVWFSLIFVLGKKYYLRWRTLKNWRFFKRFLIKIEAQICSQKKTMNQTRFDPTLNTSFTTKIDINFPIRAINPQVSNIKHSLVFSDFF